MLEVNMFGSNGIHDAAGKGNIELLKKLVAEHPEDVEVRMRHGYTPLAIAVQDGVVESAVVLLDAGADVNTRVDKIEQPLLHLAVSRWRLRPDGAMIQLLIDRGANLELKDNHGDTPFEIARYMYEFPPELLELLK
ncbi:ankyrin repeat domain-containing protein [Nakamurella antarctica]|uniref:Ankyrin repeat domain-containing protein n=1 Tax=Nakamurella antarctica TaxID=1902245 RepID=A0A3G8ZNG2_9ACTN|nr:ankyrin repeat domain-containing protein [Nakamurella antarctica]AZI58829.1 ankyrin repeat domain-containing protein [Nakamurella antarctica]